MYSRVSCVVVQAEASSPTLTLTRSRKVITCFWTWRQWSSTVCLTIIRSLTSHWRTLWWVCSIHSSTLYS